MDLSLLQFAIETAAELNYGDKGAFFPRWEQGKNSADGSPCMG